jgi:hypothetical protein
MCFNYKKNAREKFMYLLLYKSKTEDEYTYKF